MPRYSKQPLEEKFAWMRDRQTRKMAEEEADRKREGEAQAIAEQAAWLPDNPTTARRKMFRVDEVAGILHISRQTVRRWFKDRAVVVRAGHRRTTMLISEQMLDDWIRDHIGYPKRQGARR